MPMPHRLRTLVPAIFFGEGPRWRNGRLYFSDFYAHRVCSVTLAGELRIELEVEGQTSGLGWMPDGSLLVVRMERREVWRKWPDGRFERHADLGEHAHYLANDMVVDSHGRAYVGNFGFDLDSEIRSRGVESVIADHPPTPIALVQADGAVTSAAGAERFSFPNGMVITPDGKMLVVGETLAGRLTAFDIAPDGHLTGRREWAPTWPRVPDGIALDADGAIWIANPIAPECVRIAPGGEVLDMVETGGLNCFACMLGGPEGKHLFMLVAPTSDGATAARKPLGQVLVTDVAVPAAGLP